MKNPKAISYFIRFNDSYETIPEAWKAWSELPYASKFRVTYHIPQPKYKPWVPAWLINLIIKKHGKEQET